MSNENVLMFEIIRTKTFASKAWMCFSPDCSHLRPVD